MIQKKKYQFIDYTIDLKGDTQTVSITRFSLNYKRICN